MTDEMKAKREALKSLSAAAKQVIEMGEASSINEGLIYLYAQQGHTEIHSFKKWLDKGFVVKRGEKALLLWGEPIKAHNQEKQNDEEKDEFKFFPLAYVFSQLQVQPLITKSMVK